MYYINQLDYPHIRYEHDLDNGGATGGKVYGCGCGLRPLLPLHDRRKYDLWPS